MRRYYWSHPEYRQRCIEQSRERSKAQHIEDLQDYCCEHIENIENYELAKADNFKEDFEIRERICGTSANP